MNVEVLMAKLDQDNLTLERRVLNAESSRDLKRARKEDCSTVCIIPIESIPQLTKFDDITVDKGKKDVRATINRYLLHQEKIPFVDGNYSNEKTLENGIITFLKTALNDPGEENIYFIGTTDEIFGKLAPLIPIGNDCDAHETPADTDGAATPPIFEKPLENEEYPNNVFAYGNVPKSLADAYVGTSNEVKEVHQAVLKAAGSQCSVLIAGDTGTGKDIVTYQIHKLSSRRNGPYKVVNCSGIPAQSHASELFGHIKGAFTGATDVKTGSWMAAHAGTLFLDEIGDMSLDCQLRVVKALDTGKITHVGSEKEFDVDVRVIASTSRDLRSMVKAGRFKEDLYVRIRETLIETPPLFTHIQDLPAIAQDLWNGIIDKETILPEEVVREIMRYPWFGNARELKMVLNKLYSSCSDGQKPTVNDLNMVFLEQGRMPLPRQAAEASPRLEAVWKQVESVRYLQRVLEAVDAVEGILTSASHKAKDSRDGVPLLVAAAKRRIGEFEELTSSPRRFSSYDPFNKTNELKSRLLYLDALLEENTESALAFWDGQMKPAFAEIRSAITKEIQALRKLSLEADGAPWNQA